MKKRTNGVGGKQDPRLSEYGDRIIADSGYPTFIHIPSHCEVRSLISDVGLQLVEGKPRSEISPENQAVLEFTPECIMWVARVPADP